MAKFSVILKNTLILTQYFYLLICWKNIFRTFKNLTELSTIMFTFLKNWMFVLKPSNTQVDSKIPCQSQKCTYIYTIFLLFNMLKKHLQIIFIYMVSQKTELSTITFALLINELINELALTTSYHDRVEAKQCP